MKIRCHLCDGTGTLEIETENVFAMIETPGVLAESVRLARIGSGLSLRQVAGEIGVSFNVLSRAEHGKVVDTANFARIARWLRTLTAVEVT